MIFLENKYTNWYYRIITNAKEKPRQGGEIHHIIPKSLCGKNNSENLVRLSHREHFICHLLLTRMTEGQSRHKMCWALHRLTFSRKILSSHEYEIVRKIHVQNVSGNNHISVKNPNWIEQTRQRVLNDWKDNEERRLKTSERTSFLWQEKREIMLSIARKNFIEASKASANSRRGKPRPTHWKSLAGENNPQFGKPSKGAMIMKSTKATCQYCKLTTTIGNIKRWHGENCKRKEVSEE